MKSCNSIELERAHYWALYHLCRPNLMNFQEVLALIIPLRYYWFIWLKMYWQKSYFRTKIIDISANFRQIYRQYFKQVIDISANFGQNFKQVIDISANFGQNFKQVIDISANFGQNFKQIIDKFSDKISDKFSDNISNKL